MPTNKKAGKKTAKKPASTEPGTDLETPAENTGLTAEERAQRDQQIFQGFCRGLMVTTLAETYGCSTSTINRVIQKQKREVRVLTTRRKAVDVFEEHLLALDAVIDEQARLSLSGKESGSVKVAALGKKLDALREKREAYEAVGILPRDLGQMKVMLDSIQMAQQIAGVLERGEVPENVIDEIIDILDPPVSAELEAEAVEVTDAEVVE